jgi:uroporphyrinogen decarboxylase
VGNRFVNIDYMVDLGKAKRILGRSKICIKGNLNPASHLLLGTREEVARASAECLRVGGERGYMLSPGCEVPRYTPPENMEAMVAAGAPAR